MTATAPAPVWAPPAPWSVPRLWPGATCLVVCSGESVRRQREAIGAFRGPVIAVKHGVLVRPTADVFFMSGEWTVQIAADLLPRWRGRGQPNHYAAVRGRSGPELDPCFLRLLRSKAHGTLADDPRYVTGLDTGTSAINLAYHLGATTILLAGYDMQGGHFCKHPLQHPPVNHFKRHMAPLAELNADARQKGVRIVNLSPASAVTAFERGSAKEWLGA